MLPSIVHANIEFDRIFCTIVSVPFLFIQVALRQRMGMSTQDYWNRIYSGKELTKLGWYEQDPEPSIRLAKKCQLKSDDNLLIVGAGATTLVDYLIRRNFTHIIANDISAFALDLLKKRLGPLGDRVQWVQDDLTDPGQISLLEDVNLWHDRAVLHFLVNPKDQSTYFQLLRKVLKPLGYVIIAAFSLAGAKMCSGLPVKNYNSEMLEEGLGADFRLVESFDWIHTMPNGAERDYVYTLFQRS